MPVEKHVRYLTAAITLTFLIHIFIPLPWSVISTPEGGEDIGLIHYNVKGDLTPWFVKYNITASASGGALLGGGVGKKNITVDGRRYYLKGGGGAREDLGILYDSYRVKEGRLRIKAKEGFVNLTIGVEVDTVPWYREGSDIGIKVWVRVENTDVSFSRIEIKSVKIVLKQDFSDEEKVYLKNRTFKYPVSGDNVLTHPGETLSWRYLLKAPEGVGRIGLTAMVDVNFRDAQGREEDYMVPAPPNPINLYPVKTAQLLSLGGVVLSGPLALLGVILFSLTLLPKTGVKRRLLLGGAGGVISTIAPILFITGVRTMGELLSVRIKHAPEYIKVTPMPYVAIIVGILMLAITIWLSYLGHKRSEMEGEGGGKKRSKVVFRKIE